MLSIENSKIMTKLAIFWVSVCLTNGQQLSDFKQLFTDKFSNHRMEVIPRIDANTPLEIETTIYFMTLGMFDELAETIIILGGLQLTWNDPDLSWNPASYGGAVHTSVPNKYVWKPPVILVNAADVLEPVGTDSEFVAIVTYDGNVTTPIGGVMKAKCKTDIFKFPYDTQNCVLQFNVWGFLEHDAKFKVSSNPINNDFNTPNSNWDLLSITGKVRSLNGYSIFDVYITIKRVSLYYSVIVVCPTIVFGLLNPLVFLLPVSSGERIGLSMTILLSYAIFLTIVSASIPASSNPMSFLLLMMIVTIIVSGIIVVQAIVTTSLYFRQDTGEISKFWKFFVRKNRKANVKPLHVNSMADVNDCPTTKIFLKKNITWEEVSRGLDFYSVVFGYVVFIIIIIVFFTVAMLSP